MKDAETGELLWIDTSDKSIREIFSKKATQHSIQRKELFNRCGIDNIAVSTDESYITPLMNLFKSRM